MEKEKVAKAPETKPDNIIVVFVKWLLNINFAKWGVKKDF
jgi:hypothetical protein